MKRSSDGVIKSRHKGLSRKEFNRGGVSILRGESLAQQNPFWTAGKGKDAGGSLARSHFTPRYCWVHTHKDITHPFLSAQVIKLNG